VHEAPLDAAVDEEFQMLLGDADRFSIDAPENIKWRLPLT